MPPSTADAIDAASADTSLTVLVIVVLGFVAFILGGLLWWFIRDRMKNIDVQMKMREDDQDKRIDSMSETFTHWLKAQEEHSSEWRHAQEKRDEERRQTAEKRDTERRDAQAALDKERHQAVMNHYNTIETRLQGGSEIFTELRNGIKANNEALTLAIKRIEESMQRDRETWKIAVENLQKAFLDARLDFVSKNDFDKLVVQREEDRKRRDAEFAKLQKSQNDVISEMRAIRAAFESTGKTLNAAMGRLMDLRLTEVAECADKNLEDVAHDCTKPS